VKFTALAPFQIVLNVELATMFSPEECGAFVTAIIRDVRVYGVRLERRHVEVTLCVPEPDIEGSAIAKVAEDLKESLHKHLDAIVQRRDAGSQLRVVK
jgi:hypothetical protein